MHIILLHSESSKPFVVFYLILAQLVMYTKEMPVGLSASPAIWQSYINAISGSIPDRLKSLAVMDDLLLHSLKHDHLKYLEDILKALLKNGLKRSPRKCLLFRTELQYMCNTIYIKGKRVYIKPLRTRLEALQKLKPPKIS